MRTDKRLSGMTPAVSAMQSQDIMQTVAKRDRRTSQHLLYFNTSIKAQDALLVVSCVDQL